mmetsp:Transcript_33549/g.71532  ORF Transcript_33549/g.71532 Transcript_33549/m.71532 type:complete len:93 (+) Transcript_33549:175-453(+)
MKHMINVIIAVAVSLPASIEGFSPASFSQNFRPPTWLHSEVAIVEADADTIQTDAKEAVKLFGRLAEKYISGLIDDVCLSLLLRIFSLGDPR